MSNSRSRTMRFQDRLKRHLVEVAIPAYLCLVGWDYYETRVISGRSLLGQAIAVIPFVFMTSLLEHLITRTVVGGLVQRKSGGKPEEITARGDNAPDPNGSEDAE